jgi:hypothetical protein
MGRFEEWLDNTIGGVVDQHVDAGPPLYHQVNRPVWRAVDRQIVDDRLDLAALGPDQIGSFGSSRGIDVDDADAASAPRKLERDLATQPVRRSCNQDAVAPL